VIGVDASAAGMAQSSLRAARPVPRGGLPNALFAVGAAECPPRELHELADELAIVFPWGSLLRGALALDAMVAAGIARLVHPGGSVEVFVSITERDGLGVVSLGEADRNALAARWAVFGFELTDFGPAGAADIDATGSTWAKRLGAGRDRPAWRLALRRNEG
jgi:16S rRNA (adenine(1408)-N(1))-methyltransferase